MLHSPTLIRLGLIVSADLIVLTILFPQPYELKQLMHVRAAIASDGADAVVVHMATIAVWLAAVWVAIAIASSALAALPGAAGHTCRLIATAMTPTLVRRAVAGATGVGVLFGPVSAASFAAVQHSTSATLPAPVWPTSSSRAAPSAPAASDVVVVQPGDSLWTIVKHEIGDDATPARIAAQWPRWFAANRSVIGADPSLLRPGQRLTSPERRQS